MRSLIRIVLGVGVLQIATLIGINHFQLAISVAFIGGLMIFGFIRDDV